MLLVQNIHGLLCMCPANLNNQPNRSAEAYLRINREIVRKTAHGTEACSGGVGGRISVFEGRIKIGNAGTIVQSNQFHGGGRSGVTPASGHLGQIFPTVRGEKRAYEYLALTCMLENVGCCFRYDERHSTGVDLIQAYAPSCVECATPGGGDAGRIRDSERRMVRGNKVQYAFHLAMVTVVPLPGFESSSNSSQRRFAPPNPRPNPPPVVNPSCRARAISVIPGPL